MYIYTYRMSIFCENKELITSISELRILEKICSYLSMYGKKNSLQPWNVIGAV